MAIVYAVACLLCSAGNDFIFKLFVRKNGRMEFFSAQSDSSGFL